MDLWSQDKIVLFIAFFVPGFISLQIYSLFIATGDRDFTKKLPDVVAYSSIHYAIFGWILLVTHDAWNVAATYVVVLIIPVLEPFLILAIRDREGFGKMVLDRSVLRNMLSPEADPWDRYFALNRDAVWIRIRTKAGDVVGGVLGAGSHTSNYPTPHELYVSEQWSFTKDGQFEAAVASTGGFIISADQIELVEFFKGEKK